MEELTILNNRLIVAETQIKKLLNEVASIKSSMSKLMNTQSTSMTLKREYSTDSTDTNQPSKLIKLSPEGEFNYIGDHVVVYTDGACENNGKKGAKAGIGVWFGHGHPLNISAPVKGKATNNTAEIQACVKAIDAVYPLGVRKLCIRTDSQFTINAMTMWIKKWKKNNWTLSTGGPVKNKEEFQKLDAYCEKMDSIKWEHVAGHKGIEGNERADELARNGALSYTAS